MRQGDYIPSHQLPPRSSPQYVGVQNPASGVGVPPAQYWTPGEQMPLRQSRLGVASFVLALLSGFALVSLVATAGVLATRSGGNLDEKSGVAILLGLGIIGGILMSVIGGILGLIAVMQQDRKKVFAVLGLVFNGLIVLGIAGLMVVGFNA